MEAQLQPQIKPKPNSFWYQFNIVLQRIVVYTFLILLSFLFLFWMYILIINATRPSSQIQQSFSALPGTFLFTNFNTMINNTNIRLVEALWNSFFIATLSALLSTYFSALTAYGIHMYHFKLRKIAYVFILIVMIIPSQVATIGLLSILYQFRLTDNYFVLIVPAIASPATFFFMKQYMESVLPFEIVESARVDGSGEIRTFHQIVLPMIKPALAVQFIFSFVGSWNSFFFPAMIIKSPNKRTVPLIISELRQLSNPATFDLGLVYMVIVCAVIPLVVVYFIFSKHIIKGVTLGSIKG